MRRMLLVLPILLLSGLPALADDAPTATSLSGLSGAGKVAITGDNFSVDDNVHQATFLGNVVVTNDDIKLTSDKVVASYAQGGGTNISNFEATGHVKIVTKDQTATGDKAVFDPKAKILTLTGNVIVNSKTGQVHAANLLVDLVKRTSVFSAGKAGRVTGVFTSQ